MAGTRLTTAVQALREAGIGKTVAGFDVYGINSLKTLDPLPSATVGTTLTDAYLDGEFIKIEFDTALAVIDLQRTGVARVVHADRGWLPTDGPRPTVRLWFTDGTGVDFSEPAKTKRISVQLSR